MPWLQPNVIDQELNFAEKTLFRQYQNGWYLVHCNGNFVLGATKSSPKKLKPGSILLSGGTGESRHDMLEHPGAAGHPKFFSAQQDLLHTLSGEPDAVAEVAEAGPEPVHP